MHTCQLSMTIKEPPAFPGGIFRNCASEKSKIYCIIIGQRLADLIFSTKRCLCGGLSTYQPAAYPDPSINA